MKTKLITASIVFTLLAPLIFGGCGAKAQAEGFAIYLTKNDVPPSRMEDFSHVALANKPIISINDIIGYAPGYNYIEMTDEAFSRVMKLQVPTSGTSFVVCVDKQPVYWGAFWTPFSIQSFSGVMILLIPYSNALPANTIAISKGYPSYAYFKQNLDIEAPVILESLEKAGKLQAFVK